FDTRLRHLELDDESNLDTGDAVVYDNGGGADIAGLTSGTTYYVVQVEGHGAGLAATREDALASQVIRLGSVGSDAQKLVVKGHSLRADATSGAGGGKTGVAGSVAINIAHVDTQAVVGVDADDHVTPA